MDDFLKDFDVFTQSWWPYLISLIITVLSAIRLYVGGAKCVSPDRLDGKTIIITGGTSGIGQETAVQLAKRGGNIIITSRQAAKGKKALEYIKAVVPDAKVVVKLLDVSELTSVREFVNEIENEYEKIDVLINNAGVLFHPFQRTSDGFEITFATNYLGPFLLTHLLLRLLNESDNGRVINVGAQAQHNGKINIDNLNCELKYEEHEVFSQSKLALALFTKRMAELCKDSKITVNCAEPGLVRGTQHLRHSDMRKSLTSRLIVWPWMWLFMKNPTQGCQTVVYLAVEGSLRHISGYYFSDCEMTDQPEAAADRSFTNMLYQRTCRMVKIDSEGELRKAFSAPPSQSGEADVSEKQ